MRLTEKQYIERIDEIKGQIAELLASGKDVELAESRSGLKMFVVSRKPHYIKKTEIGGKENGTNGF